MTDGSHTWTVFKTPLLPDDREWRLIDHNLEEEPHMKTMSYPKEKILKALKKNREEHIKIVKEAQKGYREKAIELVSDLLKDLKAGKSVSLQIPLPVPENHVDEFDRTIEMVQMCLGKTIELDVGEFQCYVRNKWQWQNHFLHSNSTYSMTAATHLNRGEWDET